MDVLSFRFHHAAARGRSRENSWETIDDCLGA